MARSFSAAGPRIGAPNFCTVLQEWRPRSQPLGSAPTVSTPTECNASQTHGTGNGTGRPDRDGCGRVWSKPLHTQPRVVEAVSPYWVTQSPDAEGVCEAHTTRRASRTQALGSAASGSPCRALSASYPAGGLTP
jgi:hypothetical protein